VRSRTQSPCLHQAVVEIRGIPFCEACAREQEAYFAIGELTQEEKRDLRGEPPSKSLGETLGEMLEGMRRQRTDDLGAAKRLDLPRVDKPGSLRLRKARQSQPESRQNRGRRPNKVEHVSEDAEVLIRTAREVHVERHGAKTFLPGTYLSFLEAAKRAGIRSDRQRYHDAIEDLEYEGAIEWDKSARYARGDKHYLITQRGLDELGSSATVSIKDSQQKLFEG
jgi:predicted Fe-S protein YdhL (DUF1289 family)